MVDKDYQVRSSMKIEEEKIKSPIFAKCNNCYLVNLSYVKSIKGDEVILDDTSLKISRPKKTSFMNAFASFIGGY